MTGVILYSVHKVVHCKSHPFKGSGKISVVVATYARTKLQNLDNGGVYGGSLGQRRSALLKVNNFFGKYDPAKWLWNKTRRCPVQATVLSPTWRASEG